VLVWSETFSVEDDDHHFYALALAVAIGHSRELELGVDDGLSVTPTSSTIIDVELNHHLAASARADGKILGRST